MKKFLGQQIDKQTTVVLVSIWRMLFISSNS